MSIRLSTKFFASLTKNNPVNINNYIKTQDKYVRPKNIKLLGATESHHNPTKINQSKNELLDESKKYKDEIARVVKLNDYYI